MTHYRFLILLASSLLAFGQSVDSVLLLNSGSIAAVQRDPAGNLLLALRSGSAVSVARYTPQGQLIQAFTQAGQTLTSGGTVVLATDSQGVPYLGSGTTLLRPANNPPDAFSLPFPIQAIGFDPQDNPILAGASGDVAKLDRNDGKTLSAFHLGAGLRPTAMAVDPSGADYVVGSGNAPAGIQGFAVKLDASFQRQVYFTWLDAALPNGIAVDSTGNAYIAETPLAIPITIGPPNGGTTIHFGTNTVYKLDPSGAILASNSGGGLAIALNANGNLVVVGGAYPATGAFQTPCGPRSDLGGLSVSLLDPVLLHVQASAFLPQQSYQSASALLPDGSLYLANQANRVLHISPAAPSSPVACIVNGADYLAESTIAPGQLLTIFGRDLGRDPIAVFDDSQQLPFSAGTTEVRIQGIPAPLLAVSSTQINTIVPYGIDYLNPQTPAVVEILRNGIDYAWQMFPVLRDPTPLLRFGPTGALDFFQAPAYQDILTRYPVPLADVLNQDGTPNSAANPAKLGSTVTIFATGLGPLDGYPVDGAPAGVNPQWPAQPILLEAVADIPVWTPNGSLPLPFLPITTIAGHSNSLLQVTATIPANFPPGPLPFFIGTWPANAAPPPAWTNFLYTAQ